MQVEVEPFTLRLRSPLRAAWGTLERRDLLRVRVRDREGNVGVGEASPLPGYDPESLDRVQAELASGDATLPHARAALDIAEWDLRGRRAGKPVAALLAERPLRAVPVNALITAEDRAGAAAEAAAAVRAGFRCVKVKAGVGDDAGRLAAVRAAVGPAVAIRVDANGAWTVEEAVAALRALAPVGIELCEEPVHGVEETAAVRAAVAVPVAMDETARQPGAVEAGAADAVCLKVATNGGISGVMAAAAAARAAGSDVYVSSTLDGPAGIAAGLHAAAALGVNRPCGLATLGLFAGLDDPFPPRGEVIALPAGPGLGPGHDAPAPAAQPGGPPEASAT
jgi:L-alanine-DL-glutamate epimerase-like enolase superfamily enzyme